MRSAWLVRWGKNFKTHTRMSLSFLCSSQSSLSSKGGPGSQVVGGLDAMTLDVGIGERETLGDGDLGGSAEEDVVCSWRVRLVCVRGSSWGTGGGCVVELVRTGRGVVSFLIRHADTQSAWPGPYLKAP